MLSWLAWLWSATDSAYLGLISPNSVWACLILHGFAWFVVLLILFIVSIKEVTHTAREGTCWCLGLQASVFSRKHSSEHCQPKHPTSGHLVCLCADSPKIQMKLFRRHLQKCGEYSVETQADSCPLTSKENGHKKFTNSSTHSAVHKKSFSAETLIAWFFALVLQKLGGQDVTSFLLIVDVLLQAHWPGEKQATS